MVQGGGGELEVFPTSAVGQRAVSAFFQVHGHSPMMWSARKVEVSTTAQSFTCQQKTEFIYKSGKHKHQTSAS